MSDEISVIWFRFLVAALATWRLSFLVAREDGPWRLFAHIRRAGNRMGIGRALECTKCLSVWFAAPLAWFVGGSIWQMVVVWLGLSGVTVLVDEWTRPPFEWKESSENELLRRESDGAAES